VGQYYDIGVSFRVALLSSGFIKIFVKRKWNQLFSRRGHGEKEKLSHGLVQL